MNMKLTPINFEANIKGDAQSILLCKHSQKTNNANGNQRSIRNEGEKESDIESQCEREF